MDNKEARHNYGIDMLRIISMFMITIHHVLLHGGILQEADHFKLQYKVAWFLEIAVLCAVNVYGLISGYVGYGKKHNLSRIMRIYLQMIFYTLLTTFVFALFKPELLTRENIWTAVCPFGREAYWYCTAYLCLCLFMPFLDRLMASLTRPEGSRLLLGAFFLFSILQTIYNKQFAVTNNGYSFLWLAVLYLGGAYIRKYDVGKREDTGKFLAGYALSVIFVWIVKMGTEHLQYTASHEYNESLRFVTYTSPFIIICAVCLLLAFKEIKVAAVSVKLAAVFAPVALDVYLFHDEPLFRENIITGAFKVYLSFNPVRMFGAVIGTAGIIWICGSLVGRLRICFFKLLKVDNLSIWAEKKVIAMAGKLLKI